MKDFSIITRVVLGAAAAVFLYLISRDNYLLFHVLSELFSIVVAWTIFIVFWNTRKIEGNTYFLFIGIAFLFVGFIDLVHMLIYKGMNVIPGYTTNTATQLWIAARSIQAVALFMAPFLADRKIRAQLVFAVYASVTALLLSSILLWGVFPVCFVDGAGLTPFKKMTEYLICLILLASTFILGRKRVLLDKNVFYLLNLSIVIAVGSELTFTLYRDPHGFAATLGHLLKIASFYFMYRAVVQTTLIEPYSVLFRNLKQNQETQQALLDATGNRAILLSTEGKIIALNESAAEYFKSIASGLIGKKIYEFLPPSITRSVRGAIETTITSRQPVRFEEDTDGRCFDIRIYPILDSEGAVIQLAMYNEEITERKKMERELVRLSITDSLTGLFNQRQFTRRIKEEMDRARRMSYPVCLAIFDVDSFKTYNDLHGHLKGDQILRKVGEITLQSMRSGVDSGFRYGGDEFALILPYADPTMAENIIKRISLKITEKTKGVTITYGISPLQDDVTIDELITLADREMYGKKNAAKQNKGSGQ